VDDVEGILAWLGSRELEPEGGGVDDDEDDEDDDEDVGEFDEDDGEAELGIE
jgi:hypothetical protein